MSNSNTRRRKAKKLAYWRTRELARLRQGKSRAPLLLMINNPSLADDWIKSRFLDKPVQIGGQAKDLVMFDETFVLYDKERMSHPRCNHCGCDLFFSGCFCPTS